MVHPKIRMHRFFMSKHSFIDFNIIDFNIKQFTASDCQILSHAEVYNWLSTI